MKPYHCQCTYLAAHFACLGLLVMTPGLAAQTANRDGLAPEVTDLNPDDVSYALEAKLPNLATPFIDASPSDRKDGIPTGELGVDGGDKQAILKFAEEIAAGRHGEIDSLLLFHKDKLLFESYYRRGRVNYPHFQMSITKSYTAMAIGRAMQLGHLTMADLDKPVVSFLKHLDQTKLAAGAKLISLAEAMNMRSGIRLAPEKVSELRRATLALNGQGQIQAYLEHTAPIPTTPREFKYQGSDPSMVMQVLESVVPGSAREFIASEVLGKMGIDNFAWQDDVSGFPKSAAGSSMCSRDMVKWGMLVISGGKWNGEQMIPRAFVERATDRLYTNSRRTSYGFFWWRHAMKVGDREYDCMSGRGAGGQFILLLPELELITVITAHNRGMGNTLNTAPARILPAFVEDEENANSNLFDMDAIRDAATLDVDVLQDWHRVEGPVPTRQKHVTIHVGEMWPEQKYRMPVRLVVPADRKARGFHLTGGNTPDRLKRDRRLTPLEQELVKGGVGLVYTVVQVLQQSGLGELGRASEKRFLQTLNPHDKIQYWAWPATMMRAITAAHAEADYFDPDGKVAMSGGSKNGATPSMAIIHDARMTAVFASVSPIWDSPLRLCDRKAWDNLEASAGPFKHPFLGGHFGPNFNRDALAAGHKWQDLQALAEEISDSVFISRNLEALRARKVDLLFHPGTHDFVAFDLAWGGAHHSDVPVYLGANTGHGQKRPHPKIERDQQNRAAFLLRHFFPDEVEPLLSAPKVKYDISNGLLNVRVTFAEAAEEETGRIWWIFDRPPDGSPGYLNRMIQDDHSAEMKYDEAERSWTAEIALEPDATRIDFFSNHRKTIRYHGKRHPAYLSSPYSRTTLGVGK